MNENTKKIGFYVTDKKYQLLKELADKEQRTLSNMINVLVPFEMLESKLKKEVFIG